MTNWEKLLEVANSEESEQMENNYSLLFIGVEGIFYIFGYNNK